LCAAILAVCLTASAREDKDKAKASSSDQTFVMKAMQSDLAEINVSRIAVKNSNDSGVKKFAQKMIDDHSMTSDELLKIVNKKQLTGARSMDAEHEKMAKRLATMTGSAFDREFAAGQVKDHEAAVDLFKRQSKDGKDDDLKAFAKKHLPHLKEHLKMAKDLNDKVGKGNNKDKGDK